MSEQWYCPNRGPVTEVEFEDGDLCTVCVECCENVEDSPPPFVLAMQERIAALEEALTPSTETKIAYWGDDNLIGDWQAIKDIMAAIRKRADRGNGR